MIKSGPRNQTPPGKPGGVFPHLRTASKWGLMAPMLYNLMINQFTKMLQNLSACLDKAELFAEAKKFDSQVLMGLRLAPDQFDLMRQVQIACDTAKGGVARVTGKEAPAHDDTEKSLAEAKARIDKVIAYLQTFSPEDFADAKAREITTPRWKGKTLTGAEYALQHAIPNLYFHVTTAYAILRHNGVDVGKKDYLGPMPFKPAPQ